MATLMQVIIRTLTGNHIRIGVEPNDPVRELKRLIEERTGVPIDRQRLIFAGKLLEDHRSLAYYKITEDSTIHLVLSLKHDNPPKIWNTYIDSKPILTEPVSSPIALQYTSAHPSITKIDSRIVSQCKNYQELFLKLWFENHQMYPESSTKTSEKRLAKYKEILSNIYKRSVCIYGEPHKGWKSDARKVLPIVMAKCGYSEAEIELVKDTKLFDIVDAFKFIEQRRIELINETTPAPELAHFFFNQHDLVLGSLMPHLSLCDRMHFSNTCKEFNSMARQPIVWRHLCLLHDRARVRDKHFMNILQQYGSYIQALSVQKCLRLTEMSLMLIGDKCPNLRILNAADNPLFDHDEQNAVFMKATKLQVINLSLTSPDPLPKPIGRIDVLKELKELNISGRRQTKDGAITHETLKVLDIRGSITGSLNINCSQLEVLFVDQPHTHPKQTMQRTAKIYISHGASDPQSFEGKEANSSDQLDEYRVVNS